MREVREVGDWWGEEGLGYYLYIPRSKREEIRQKFPDEMEQKKQLISHWINTDPLASWRRLIVALDHIKETKMADSIRSYAEPLTGKEQMQLFIDELFRITWNVTAPYT